MGYSYGTFTDTRDGKTYKTVKIGNQIWMAENLAYKASEGCMAYAGEEKNIIIYGYLYNWETAIKICPSGWHLPSDKEWDALINYLGGAEISGKKMKNTSGWRDEKNGTNSSGFTGLPGGFSDDRGYCNVIGGDGYWWSSTGLDNYSAWRRNLSFFNDSVVRDDRLKKHLLSVRCIKD